MLNEFVVINIQDSPPPIWNFIENSYLTFFKEIMFSLSELFGRLASFSIYSFLKRVDLVTSFVVSAAYEKSFNTSAVLAASFV